ncbi:hypothetical protein D3C86_2213260 [compost metagenome]
MALACAAGFLKRLLALVGTELPPALVLLALVEMKHPHNLEGKIAQVENFSHNLVG